jgi:hypothetical protein
MRRLALAADADLAVNPLDRGVALGPSLGRECREVLVDDDQVPRLGLGLDFDGVAKALRLGRQVRLEPEPGPLGPEQDRETLGGKVNISMG